MFPPFDEWCKDVLHPEDTHPWNFRTPEFYNEYRSKYAIGRLVKPERILEVGVRFGYSARAFLSATPWAAYVGLDMDEPSWGPYKGVPRLWAEQRLKEKYLHNNIHTYHCNTQTDPIPPIGQFDLVHIDADHSYKGALHDLETFWPHCTNVMVVDDFIEVNDSVTSFLDNHPEAVLFGLASLRSSGLIVRV